MTPPLHPRSRLTTSLFGTTLLVSFLVVGMPHILPCPAPRVQFAESDFEVMQDGRRRRRRTSQASVEEGTGTDSGKQIPLQVSDEEKTFMRTKAHECPVPKPRGIIGRVLGFKNEDSAQEEPRPQVMTNKELRVREDHP